MGELLEVGVLAAKLWLIGEIIGCAFAVVIGTIALICLIKAFFRR